MYISFDLEATQAEKIALPVHQRFSLVQGLLLLEQANQEVLATKQGGTIAYFLYTGKEQELPILEAELLLPVKQKDMLDVLLEPVTNDPTLDPIEVKNFLQLVNQSLPKKQRAKSNKKSTEKKATIDTKPVKKKVFLSVSLITLIGLILLMSGFLLGKTNSTPYQEKELEVKKELNTLTEQVNEQNKVETFTRFFLTQEKQDAKTRQAVLKKFVKKETLSDFLSEKSRARSMFPWEVKKKDKQWTIAFIVVLINEKDEQSTKKITFTAEETKEQLVVMERPTEEDFELTN
uniref:Orf7 protein n=1 Tax=Enterococcus faecalis TaxID=1351 RepID=Q47790_ENTFL|nr:orf7 [Enterococcus faecalis] [Enterococcus faecalis OG1X]